MLVVVAIGGNAILNKNEKPGFERQFKNMQKLSKELIKLSNNHKLVLAFGKRINTCLRNYTYGYV